MSQDSHPEERTEQPTDRRMTKLRQEGQIHVSMEVAQVLSLIAAFFMLTVSWGSLYDVSKTSFFLSYQRISDPTPLTISEMLKGMNSGLKDYAFPLMMVLVVTALTGSLAVFIQTKFNVKEKKIHFRWGALNPINGLKRIFSLRGLVTTGQALLKLAILLPVTFFALKAAAPEMVALMHLSVTQFLSYCGMQISSLFWKVVSILIAFAIFDWAYGKWEWLRQNRMTKNEVKDERKSVEGDEETKRKIQMKGLQRIMQRIRQSVPTADVIITNPTHYAIALKYDKDNMDAPVVVAKGLDFLAERIKDIAREAGVPIVERKALARSLYASVEVGQSIPRELFRAVAEVLAFVFKQKRKFQGSVKTGQ